MSSSPADQKQLIKVGSRKSQLALIQTNMVIDMMTKLYSNLEFEIVPISTTGDQILDRALSKIGEKSLFTRELENALSSGEIHMAVHSLKDMPTTLPDDMVIGAICRREDHRDAVILSSLYKDKTLDSLPEGSVIGTSSLRRVAQLTRKYPHLKMADVRGNLNTRFRKMDEDGLYAGLILAAAGVKRLGKEDRISQYLEPDECLYAVGQGALGVECCSTNHTMIRLLSQLHHTDTLLCCMAERSLMKKLEGGCSIPLGVCSKVQDGQLTLTAGVFSLDGSKSVTCKLSKKLPDLDETDHSVIKVRRLDVSQQYTGIAVEYMPKEWLETAGGLGVELGERLLEQGAGDVLRAIRTSSVITKTPTVPPNGTADPPDSGDCEIVFEGNSQSKSGQNGGGESIPASFRDENDGDKSNPSPVEHKNGSQLEASVNNGHDQSKCEDKANSQSVISADETSQLSTERKKESIQSESSSELTPS